MVEVFGPGGFSSIEDQTELMAEFNKVQPEASLILSMISKSPDMGDRVWLGFIFAWKCFESAMMREKLEFDYMRPGLVKLAEIVDDQCKDGSNAGKGPA